MTLREQIEQKLEAARRWYRVSAGTHDARIADAEMDAAIKLLASLEQEQQQSILNDAIRGKELAELSAAQHQMREQIRAMVGQMRNERIRYKSHDLGYADSVSSNTVEDWADELSALVDLPSKAHGGGGTSTRRVSSKRCERRTPSERSSRAIGSTQMSDTTNDTPSLASSEARPVTETQDALAKIERAHQMISDLNHQRQRWVMSIPARPDEDPDLVVGEALSAAERLLRSTPQPAQAETPQVDEEEGSSW